MNNRAVAVVCLESLKGESPMCKRIVLATLSMLVAMTVWVATKRGRFRVKLEQTELDQTKLSPGRVEDLALIPDQMEEKKQKLLFAVAETKSPSDVLDDLQVALSMSTKVFRSRAYPHGFGGRAYKEIDTYEIYAYADGTISVKVFYYKNGALNGIHIHDTNGTRRWVLWYKQDGVVSQRAYYAPMARFVI